MKPLSDIVSDDREPQWKPLEVRLEQLKERPGWCLKDRHGHRVIRIKGSLWIRKKDSLRWKRWKSKGQPKYLCGPYKFVKARMPVNLLVKLPEQEGRFLEGTIIESPFSLDVEGDDITLRSNSAVVMLWGAGDGFNDAVTKLAYELLSLRNKQGKLQ